MNVMEKASEYHYRIYFDWDSGKYTATCLELPLLSFIEDFSRTKAYMGIFNMVCDVLNDMEEEDLPDSSSKYDFFSRERKEARKKEDKKLKEHFQNQRGERGTLEDWRNIIVKKKA